MARLGELIRLGRPHFLVGTIVFIGLGVALAQRVGTLDAFDVALAFAVSLCTQWAVHYSNELHDLAADQANAGRTRLAGGSGVLVMGKALPSDAAGIARGLWMAAVTASALLAVRAPVSLWASGPVMLLAWAYSAPPLRLCARGLGELAAGLVVAAGVPALILLPAGASSATFLPLALLVLQLAAAVAVLSLPDAASDAATGKRTLAVRLGPRPTRVAIQTTWMASGLATTLAILAGGPPAFALAGGAALTASVALPLLVLRRQWDLLAVVAVGVVALQVGLTLLWALF